MAEDADLPKALVKRITKAKLAELERGDGDEKRALQLNKDALLALSEGAKVFILYLTATASATCKAAGRQTLSEEDVMTALADIQFGDMVPQLREATAAFRQKQKNKAIKPKT